MFRRVSSTRMKQSGSVFMLEEGHHYRLYGNEILICAHFKCRAGRIREQVPAEESAPEDSTEHTLWSASSRGDIGE